MKSIWEWVVAPCVIWEHRQTQISNPHFEP